MLSRFIKYFHGTYTDNKGYKRFCDSGRSVHRYIVEKKLGRRLGSDEVVHHKDGNKRNNSYSNLQICTRSQHYWMHKRKKRYSWRKRRRYYDSDDW